MHQPQYAILRTKKLRLSEIPALGAHNNRSMPTPNADPQVTDGVQVLRCLGKDPLDAYIQRVRNSGAKPAGRNRHAAFEVVLALSPGSPIEPPEEVFFHRSQRFLDDVYGAENTVCIWGHRDEKSPHVHALVVPICSSSAPGRPRKGTAKTQQPTVSWNQFSGSAKRSGNKATNNPVMASWQSAWSNLWQDYGYRRGIPSRRDALLMPWIRGQTAAIQALAVTGRDNVVKAMDALLMEPDQVAQLAAKGELKLEMEKNVAKVRGAHLAETAALQELAARGVQLDVERQARAELGDKLEAQQATLIQLSNRVADDRELIGQLSRENENLRRQNEYSEPKGKLGSIIQTHVLLSSLEDEEFNAVIEQAHLNRLSMRLPTPSIPEQRSFRALPTPRIEPGHSLG